MVSYISEPDFRRLYDLYLQGHNLNQIAEANWRGFGYSSKESFRVSLRGRLSRRNFPIRDVAATRRTKAPTKKTIKTLTSEERQELKNRINKKRRRIIKVERGLKRGYS